MRRRAMLRQTQRNRLIRGLQEVGVKTNIASSGTAIYDYLITDGEYELDTGFYTCRNTAADYHLYFRYRTYNSYRQSINYGTYGIPDKGYYPFYATHFVQLRSPCMYPVFEIEEHAGQGRFSAQAHSGGDTETVSYTATTNTDDPTAIPADTEAYKASVPYLYTKDVEGTPTTYQGAINSLYLSDCYDRPYCQRIGIHSKPRNRKYATNYDSTTLEPTEFAYEGARKKNPHVWYRIAYAEHGQKLVDLVPIMRVYADGSSDVGFWDRVSRTILKSTGTKQFQAVMTAADEP